MKCFRLSLAAFFLTLTLTGSAFAGDIQCPIAPPAPPLAVGEMPLPGIASTYSVTEIALGLVQSVLSLF